MSERSRVATTLPVRTSAVRTPRETADYANRPIAPAVIADRIVAKSAVIKGPSLGTAYLGIGASLLCAIEAVYGLAVFAGHLDDYESLVPVVLAWVLFIGAFAVLNITIAKRGERLSMRMFVVYLVVLGAVVALDFIAIWSLHDIGRYATASVAAGLALVRVVPLRPPPQVFTAALVLLAAFVIATLLDVPLTADNLPLQITTISLAVFAPLFALFVLKRFRILVQLELDRVLFQGTVSASRADVGMLASAELARLDLAAEDLLESVASGRSPLPLDPETASKAASLATELRLHLIEGRKETWLHYAVTDSAHLGKAVTLTDVGSLAGLLVAQQRDGLLAAVWLLVADTKKRHSLATVVLTPVEVKTDAKAGKTVTVSIVITAPGHKVDPSTWAAIAQVGTFTDSTVGTTLTINIQCVVPNPATL